MSVKSSYPASSKLEKGLFIRKNIRTIEVKEEFFQRKTTVKARGSIEFEKDKITVYQKFEGKTFEDIVAQMTTFIEKLP